MIERERDILCDLLLEVDPLSLRDLAELRDLEGTTDIGFHQLTEDVISLIRSEHISYDDESRLVLTGKGSAKARERRLSTTTLAYMLYAKGAYTSSRRSYRYSDDLKRDLELIHRITFSGEHGREHAEICVLESLLKSVREILPTGEYSRFLEEGVLLLQDPMKQSLSLHPSNWFEVCVSKLSSIKVREVAADGEHYPIYNIDDAPLLIEDHNTGEKLTHRDFPSTPPIQYIMKCDEQ